MKSVMCQVHEPIIGGIKITKHESIARAKKYCISHGLKFDCIERLPPSYISFKDIENLAKQIKTYLVKKDIASDACIYYNNCRESSFLDMETGKYTWKKETDIDPHNYFCYAAFDHILSMSFEGPFYDVINGYMGSSILDGFQKILDNYGLYYELGNYWNLTVSTNNSYTKVDYTRYKKEPDPICLYMRNINNIEKELADVMLAWNQMSKSVGDIGSCVIGAGFNFLYNGEKYWMSECSPYQGSISWETNKDDIEKMLEEIGATEIYYNWGVMD